jgi:hypothetical protein
MHYRPRVFEWNGKDLPAALNDLPVGRYVVEEIGPRRKLSADEQAGLLDAIGSIREGRAATAKVVHRRLREAVAKVAGRKKSARRR